MVENLPDPEVIKCFSCSAEHKSRPAIKFQITNNCKFFLDHTDHTEVSLLINMKMPTIVGNFIFISRENFMLS